MRLGQGSAKGSAAAWRLRCASGSIRVREFSFWYGEKQALFDITSRPRRAA